VRAHEALFAYDSVPFATIRKLPVSFDGPGLDAGSGNLTLSVTCHNAWVYPAPLFVKGWACPGISILT